MKYKSIIFDFDSTIVSVESLDILVNISSKDQLDKEEIVQKIKDITNLGMNGTITFNESLLQRIAIIAPIRSDILKASEKIAQLITKSFLEDKNFFSQNAKNIYIISGGFEEMMIPTIKQLGILESNVFANKFLFDNSDKVKGFDTSRLTSQNLGKVKQLQTLKLPQPVVIIGDGYTDYEIKKNKLAQSFIVYTEHAYRENIVANADFEAKSFKDILNFIT